MIGARQHLAVVMARGESLRMGTPKGLCRLNPDDLPFAVQICQLYLDLDFSVLVVVNHRDEAAYKECLTGLPVDILSADIGGDTAQTMNLARQWSGSHSSGETCFWAHPVDMPLVRSKTISHLLDVFSANKPDGLRPWYDDQPGHPVLLLGNALASVLSEGFESLSMAAAWKKTVALHKVQPLEIITVDDSGVVADFDRPEHLTSFRPTKET